MATVNANREHGSATGKPSSVRRGFFCDSCRYFENFRPSTRMFQRGMSVTISPPSFRPIALLMASACTTSLKAFDDDLAEAIDARPRRLIFSR